MSKCNEHYVVVEVDPEYMVLTAGEQGPPGASAFEQWLSLNPGGTWAEFMSDIGSGAIWQEAEW